MIPEVKLICPSSGVHIWQLYAGFARLAQQGEVSVSLERSQFYSPGANGSHLRAIVNGRRIVFDTDDSEDCPDIEMRWAEHYFKRSFNIARHPAACSHTRLHPLGLNYPVTSRGDWWARRSLWTLLGLRADNYREVLSQAIRLLPFLSRSSAAGRDACNYRGFEQSPTHAGDAVVLMARTWDPTKKHGLEREQRAAMNSMRVESIRQLRTALGPRFIGGLMPTDFALHHYPDLTLDSTRTSKGAFLASVRDAAICITSTGLVNTNGWRLAEFTAASRPILTEPLLHQIPGVFEESRNYHSYHSPEELVKKVDNLLRDEEARHAMRQANHQYYKDHVRPDSLVRSALRTALTD